MAANSTYKYRLWCSTEETFVFRWEQSLTPPTTCPNNSEHTIDTSQTTIVDKVIPGFPLLEDGRPLFNPCLFPEGTYMYVCGFADHLTNGRGEGEMFALEKATEGDEVLTFSFNDWVMIVGGWASYQNAVIGDYLKFEVVTPASSVQDGGTQNCILVPVGGGVNLIYPMTPGTGTHEVDLDTAIPVTARDINGNPNGYWMWSAPDEGLGIISTSSPLGSGDYNLFDTELTIVRHVKGAMLGTGRDNFTIEAIEAKILLPQWNLKITMHHASGTHDLKLVFNLILGRKKTV